MVLEQDPIRRVYLRPYAKGRGPTFTLQTYATGRYDSRGCTVQAYELRQHENGRTTVIFKGSDFCGSPMHADDADETIAALLGFLTLRPGDTDEEYFAEYTPEQIAFSESHAEYLGYEAMQRFGED